MKSVPSQNQNHILNEDTFRTKQQNLAIQHVVKTRINQKFLSRLWFWDIFKLRAHRRLKKCQLHSSMWTLRNIILRIYQLHVGFHLYLRRVTFVEQTRPQPNRLWPLSTCRPLNKSVSLPSWTFRNILLSGLTKVLTISAARTHTIYELFTQSDWQHVSFEGSLPISEAEVLI